MTLIGCGALRQGNIALIHSAPTGEKVHHGEEATWAFA